MFLSIPTSLGVSQAEGEPDLARCTWAARPTEVACAGPLSGRGRLALAAGSRVRVVAEGSPHVAPALHFKLLCTASAGALNFKKGGFQGEVLARRGPGREPVGGPEALLKLRRRGGPGTRQQYPMDATQAEVHVELRESERWPETEARARRSRGYSHGSMPVFGHHDLAHRGRE